MRFAELRNNLMCMLALRINARARVLRGCLANSNFLDCSADLNTQTGSELIFPSNIYESRKSLPVPCFFLCLLFSFARNTRSTSFWIKSFSIIQWTLIFKFLMCVDVSIQRRFAVINFKRVLEFGWRLVLKLTEKDEALAFNTSTFRDLPKLTKKSHFPIHREAAHWREASLA